MPIEGREQGKVIKYLLGEDEGDEALYTLTFRQARSIMQTVEYLRWTSRHIRLPTNLDTTAKLDTFVSDIELRLMHEVNPLENLCTALSDCADQISDIITDALNNESPSDAQQALRDALKDTIDNYVQNNITNIIGKGSPLNPSVTADTDAALFGACVKVITYTYDVWGDIFQQLEEVSNNEELIKHGIDSLPFMKFLTDAIPIDGWLDDLDYLLSLSQEGLDAGYTVDEPDGSLFIMACAVYCACKSDKTITVDRVYNALVGLLSGYTIPSFENIDNWLSTLLGVDDNDPLICYALFSLLWGVCRNTSFFGNVRLSDGTFKLIVKEGASDTSRNPDDYCEDCNDGWCRSSVAAGDLETAYTAAVTIAGTQAQWYSDRWGHNSSVQSRITLHCDLGASYAITSIRIVMDAAIGGGDLNKVVIFNNDFSVVYSSGDGIAITEHGIGQTIRYFSIDVEGDAYGYGYPLPCNIIEVQIRGTGTAPSIGEPC